MNTGTEWKSFLRSLLNSMITAPNPELQRSLAVFKSTKPGTAQKCEMADIGPMGVY